MRQEFSNQLFHPSNEPLDSAQEVEDLDKLNSADFVVGYVGMLVHVKAEHKTYLCVNVEMTPSGPHCTWSPLFRDDGKAFYLRADDGSVFEITAIREGADGKGRVIVAYPTNN